MENQKPLAVGEGGGIPFNADGELSGWELPCYLQGVMR